MTVERTGITVGQADIDDWTSGGSKDITLQEARTLTFDPNGGSGTIKGDKVFEGATTSLPDDNDLTPQAAKPLWDGTPCPEAEASFMLRAAR